MVSMIKRLLSLISRKSSTIQSNPRNNAANEVVRCGNAALAKLDLENWNSDEKQAKDSRKRNRRKR
jgi:hypothetical protein